MRLVKWFALAGVLFFVFYMSSCEKDDENNIELFYQQVDYRQAYQVIGYEGSAETLEIPETYLDLPVIGIKYNAFSQASIDTIIIPDSIEFIQSSAFKSTGIKHVLISETSQLKSLEMGAFWRSSVKSVYIPKDAIVDWASEDIILEEVTIHPEHQYYQEIDGLIYSIDGTKLYFVPPMLPIETLHIPEGVVSIEYVAATEQKTIKTIYLPNSLTTIGLAAFYGSHIEHYIFDEDSTLETIGKAAFENTRIQTIDLPNTLISIDDDAFKNVILSSIKLPSSLETIGDGAFWGSIIQSIEFDELSQLKIIGTSAFARMNQLKEIVIPELVTTIGSQAFYDSGIEHITFLGDDVILNSDVFTLTHHLISVSLSETHPLYHVENGIVYDQNMTELICYPNQHPDQVYHLPMTLMTIHPRTLDDSKIESFESSFNPHFTTIDGVLFNHDVTSLVKYPSNRPHFTYQIPLGVETVEPFALSGTKHLETLIISSSVTEFKDNALAHASFIYMSFMPNSKLHTIGTYFMNWTSVAHLVIPKSVQTIEDRAFNGAKITLLEFEEGFNVVLSDDIVDRSMLYMYGIILPEVQHTFSIQTLSRFRHVYFPSRADIVPELETSTSYLTFFYFEDDLRASHQHLEERISKLYYLYDLETFRQKVLGTSYSS